MALDARKEAAERAVNGLLGDEAAICGSDPYCYSMTASAAFEEIALLRGRGVRFDKICAAFTKAGLLPDDAKPHSLSQAFLREKGGGKRSCGQRRSARRKNRAPRK